MDRKPLQRQNSSESAGFTEVGASMTDYWTRWLRTLFPNLRDAAIRWSEDDASSMAASVAYYLALSLFPMMLLLTTGIGLFFQFSNFGRDAEAQILDAVQQQASPVVSQQIEEVLKQLRNQSIVSGPFGIIAAILAAIGVFAQIDRGFDRIFRIPARKGETMRRTIYRLVRHRCLAFLMLLGLGGTILILFATSMILAQFRSVTGNTLPSLKQVFGLFDTIVAVLLNGILFGFVYRWLPKKKVAWVDALRGGLLAACVWELGRTLLGMFFIGMRYTSAYGVIGSFIAILLWCYYGISIIFFGAEYVQVLEQNREADEKKNEPSLEAASSTDPGSVGMPLNDSAEIGYDEHSRSKELESEAGRPILSPQVDVDRQQPRRSSSAF